MDVDRYICPGCGREVAIGPAGCRHCQPAKPKLKKSAKPKPRRLKRSWEQDGIYDGLDLPDEDFDYEDFVAREFGRKPHDRIGVKWYWWVLGLGLILTWLIWAILGLFHW